MSPLHVRPAAEPFVCVHMCVEHFLVNLSWPGRWRLILELRKLVLRKGGKLTQGLTAVVRAGILAHLYFSPKSKCVAVVLWEWRLGERHTLSHSVWSFSGSSRENPFPCLSIFWRLPTLLASWSLPASSKSAMWGWVFLPSSTLPSDFLFHFQGPLWPRGTQPGNPG